MYFFINSYCDGELITRQSAVSAHARMERTKTVFFPGPLRRTGERERRELRESERVFRVIVSGADTAATATTIE